MTADDIQGLTETQRDEVRKLVVQREAHVFGITILDGWQPTWVIQIRQRMTAAWVSADEAIALTPQPLICARYGPPMLSNYDRNPDMVALNFCGYA